jgi:hypothetical protein
MAVEAGQGSASPQEAHRRRLWNSRMELALLAMEKLMFEISTSGFPDNRLALPRIWTALVVWVYSCYGISDGFNGK